LSSLFCWFANPRSGAEWGWWLAGKMVPDRKVWLVQGPSFHSRFKIPNAEFETARRKGLGNGLKP
jgi:hypothetical protein